MTRTTIPARKPKPVAGRPAAAKAARPSSSTEELRKSDATRQRILDAAALVMSREGFSGTKLVDIATEAQLKIATLYYYYPSREALVEAVMVTGSEHVRHHTQEALDAMPPNSKPVDRLCVAVESHLRFILEISNYTQAVIRNVGQVPEHVRASLTKEISTYGRLWQGLVDDAAEGTEFKSPAQRKALRLLIIGGMNWTVEWWNTTQMPLDDVVRTAVLMTRSTLAKRR